MLSGIEAAAGNPKLITLYTFDFSQYRYPRGPLVLDSLGRLQIPAKPPGYSGMMSPGIPG
jgi:hypothetical protein